MVTVAGTYDFVYIDGVGSEEEYAAVNAVIPLEGKVVVVNRGGLSFFEKGTNLIAFSPKALVIANNVPGIIGLLLDDYTGTFPVVSMTLSDANAIKACSESTEAGGYTCYTGSAEVIGETVAEINGERAVPGVSPVLF